MCRPQLLILVAAVSAFSGCTVVQSLRESSRQMAKTFTPESFDEDNPADDPGDPWIADASREGRHDYKVEKEYDPLSLKQYMMSNRARAIESDLGIE